MSVRHRLGHAVLNRVVAAGGRRFVRDSHALERVQRARLAGLVRQVAQAHRHPSLPGVDGNWHWEDFSRALPITDYRDWSAPVEAQRRWQEGSLIDSPVMRYQPTSGSTSEIKWVPYTRAFLRELDGAIAPWLHDLYRQFPGIRQGSHYWSVSWLPDGMRDSGQQHLNDDMKVLTGGKRLLASMTQSVPELISLASTSDDAQFATLAWLVADQHLTVLSVWSPSFALTLFERMVDWRDELIEVLRRGDWGSRRAALPAALRCPRAPRAAALLADWDGRLNADVFVRLWPRLALVSAWDTAAAAPWATLLQQLLPQAAFQGKGLWATEGVVTVPCQGQWVLAYQSHVYEFEDLDSGRILPPWALRPGQDVAPLLSTGSGLLRYRLNDRLRVDGHLNSLPVLRFLGRNDGVDMVGEKIGAVYVQQVLDALPWGETLRPVTLLAARQSNSAGKPGYVLLVECAGASAPPSALQRIKEHLEAALAQHFHYQLARGLGQLAPARVVCRQDMREFYLHHCRLRGMIEGNIKIEPLRDWPEVLPPALHEISDTRGSLSGCAI